ncbi:DUF551 domain-containing protein [Stenoxybacter acetivorans]|uniref:DUF551 domain-containing protein n=1 Tax=Stenoxybacter acetivorans TaxID=422441 RepID=UPI00055AAA37|nr:DUF551 domain-containing protein [Stenoxybacter acetivorans]
MNMNNWIPCKKELPKKWQVVLTYRIIKGKDCYEINWITTDGFGEATVWENDEEWEKYDYPLHINDPRAATHWQPLAPPKPD